MKGIRCGRKKDVHGIWVREGDKEDGKVGVAVGGEKGVAW